VVQGYCVSVVQESYTPKPTVKMLQHIADYRSLLDPVVENFTSTASLGAFNSHTTRSPAKLKCTTSTDLQMHGHQMELVCLFF